jgi:CTP:molybdopterin cytidylyltransferase MocA
MNLTGDRGARGLLDQLGEQVVLIEAEDDGVLLDVDRPEDKPP